MIDTVFAMAALIVMLVVILMLMRQLNYERTERNKVAERHQALALTVRYAQLTAEHGEVNGYDIDLLRKLEEEQETLTSVHEVEGS